MEKKVALVTGASRGIGRQISLTLAKEGMFVVVNYCGSEARAKNVLEEIRKNGGDGVLYQCDVADYQQTEAMAKELIKSYGHVDVLVRCVGKCRTGKLCSIEGRNYRTYKDGGEGTGKQRHHGQCGSPGICSYGDDRSTFKSGERGSSSTDSTGKIRRDTGYCQYGGISCV